MSITQIDTVRDDEVDAKVVPLVYALINDADPRVPEFLDKLAALHEKHGDSVFSELVHMLSDLRFEPGEAACHWQAIVSRRDDMAARLDERVDLRVAMASYFLQVDPRLQSPKLIELRKFEQTRESVYRDELTGLHNYRFFAEMLPREMARCERANLPLSLLMVDLDDFKTYNDRFGHEAGNDVLRGVAEIVLAGTRRTDVAARYGGEEFALILPDTPKPGARVLADRLRRAIRGERFLRGTGHPETRLTASVGVATAPGDGIQAGDLVENADHALYQAKGDGKNQVRMFGDSSRSFRRVDSSLKGALRPLSEISYRLETLQISEGGILLATSFRPEIGGLLEMSLDLPRSDRAIHVAANVVQVRAGKDDGFEVAVQIVQISREDKSRLVSHLRQASIPD